MKKIIFLFAFLMPILAYAQDSDTTIYDVVDTKASFVGGDKELIKFLANNLRFSTKMGQMCGEFTSHVKFVIEKDGSINQNNIKVVKSIREDLDTEVIRVVKISPNWIPAMHKGKPVRQRQRIPIRIRIQ